MRNLFEQDSSFPIKQFDPYARNLLKFMKAKKFFSLLKPLVVWSIVLPIAIELILHRTLNDLPNKFLNHSTGPIQRLGQYSKEKVMPSNYIAMLGDSNVYGFGPWLYDNSWSMEQPDFATHHLLHENLGTDIMAFGYPGYGTLGSCLSMVSEMEMFDHSWIWSDLEHPKHILVVFYEGNDLINNLHEIEQREFNISQPLTEKSKKDIDQVILKESEKLRNSWSVFDHSASWNLFSGLIRSYLNKRKPSEEQCTAGAQKASMDNKRQKSVELTITQVEENLAIINGNRVSLGYCEGPALHLNNDEINLSMEIARKSLSYLKQNFSKSKIDLLYLPSSLSIYKFADCVLRPAPLNIKGETRNNIFDPADASKKNEWLRSEFSSLSNSLGFGFIDTTPFLKDKARLHLLHGPRDPIHLNRKGYEFFSEAIIKQLEANL